MAADAAPADVNAQTYEEQGDAGHKRRNLLIGLAIAALVILLAILIWSMFAQVPDVIGLNAYSADRVMTKAGFKVGDVGRTNQGKVRAGHVAWQAVLPGAWRLKGSEVDLKLKKGTDVTIEPEAPAPSSDEPRGEEPWWVTDSVAMQDTETVVPAGLVGTVGGVPNVLGMTLSEARSTLSSKGYGASVFYGPSTAGVPEGQVYYQKPSKGESLAQGSAVVIWISTGPLDTGFRYPQPVPTPDVP